MSLPDKPLTIRSLAARLHLSAMTVSRALRNAPGVSAETRKLVVAAAAHRGYKPDPSLAVLNAYRHGRRHLLAHEAIAFLTNFSTADEWRRVDAFLRYFNGAKARAAELGYTLEHFWLRAPELTDRRASQILVNRGVRGLMIGPLELGGTTLQLEWTQFTAVALGRSLLHPALTTVSPNHFQAVELAWETAWARGYRRIGLVLTEAEEARTVGALHASHFMQQCRHAGARIPVLITPDCSGTALPAWARQYQPDLIIGSNHGYYEALRLELGPAAHAIKFLHLNTDPSSEMGGIDQGHDTIGRHAMSTLHSKMIARETGLPERRELTCIDGVWKEGQGEWQLPPASVIAARELRIDAQFTPHLLSPDGRKATGESNRVAHPTAV